MKKIDLDSVMRKKSPRLYKFLPKFILNYLKNIIHQDELNKFLTENPDAYGNDFTKRGLDSIDVTYEVKFSEEIDRDGKYILASNHPLGGADGIMLIDFFSRYFKKVLFPVNDILMEVDRVSEFFVPINKHGSQSRQVAQKMEEAFASDAQMLIFPAGLVSRKRAGKIRDPEWKKNFVVKAKNYKRDVIPVHISGRNSNFFYNLANLRTFLGIKTNIEMLYLCNELFKQRGNKFVIKVGKPIKYNTFNSERTPIEWASYVKDKVYKLDNE